MGRQAKLKRERRRQREEQRHLLEIRGEEGRERGCLFCRGDGPFMTREHVFAEALGNAGDRYILPPGVVCDRCNNGPLASVDAALAGFHPIAMQRTLLRISGKRGRVPVTRWSNATVASPAAGHVVLEERGKGAWTRTGPNSATWKLRTAGPIREPTWAKIARGMWKIGLELIWLDHGAEEAMSAKYDELRSIVCGQTKGFAGWLLIPREGNPDDRTISATYKFLKRDDGLELVPLTATFFGVAMYTELLVREAVQPENEQERRELDANASIIVFDLR